MADDVSPCTARRQPRVVNAITRAFNAVDALTRSSPLGDRLSAPRVFGRQQSESAVGTGPGSSRSHASRNALGTPCASSFG